MVTSVGEGTASSSWEQDGTSGRVTSKTVTLTASAEGAFSVHALCGGNGATPMYLATPLLGTIVANNSPSGSNSGSTSQIVSGGEMPKCDAIKACEGTNSDGTFCAGKSSKVSACSLSSKDTCEQECSTAQPGTGTSNAKANSGAAQVSWRCVTSEDIKKGCADDSSASSSFLSPSAVLFLASILSVAMFN